jgi:hypothetical protein
MTTSTITLAAVATSRPGHPSCHDRAETSAVDPSGFLSSACDLAQALSPRHFLGFGREAEGGERPSRRHERERPAPPVVGHL